MATTSASPTILSSGNPSHVASTCAAHGLDPSTFAALHEHARAAKATAYCPYSQFRVGAALLAYPAPAEVEARTGTGTGSRAASYVRGANVENASYPVGTCAERVAFGKAVTEGMRDVKAVAVCTDVEPPASPCGMCRQFIREFCDLKTPIIMFDVKGNYIALKLQELLPLSFGPDALPSPEALVAARAQTDAGQVKTGS